MVDLCGFFGKPTAIHARLPLATLIFEKTTGVRTTVVVCPSEFKDIAHAIRRALDRRSSGRRDTEITVVVTKTRTRPVRTSEALLQSGGDEFHFSLSQTMDNRSKPPSQGVNNLGEGQSQHCETASQLQQRLTFTTHTLVDLLPVIPTECDETLLLELREPGTISKSAAFEGSRSGPGVKELFRPSGARGLLRRFGLLFDSSYFVVSSFVLLL